ncbi:hypothetical protein BCR43DRAFT_11099 [Syncephalastrum racemosum]|uniref:Uncharacterized protein n=1 Tax=Syncephalastrum racemosum TaxID=13706 RepID=A0A1X2HSE6_SYNRA|nr:hypothetical protein BCR43DRAFT_11099 [Syncephalastrum racemosum]
MFVSLKIIRYGCDSLPFHSVLFIIVGSVSMMHTYVTRRQSKVREQDLIEIICGHETNGGSRVGWLSRERMVIRNRHCPSRKKGDTGRPGPPAYTPSII